MAQSIAELDKNMTRFVRIKEIKDVNDNGNNKELSHIHDKEEAIKISDTIKSIETELQKEGQMEDDKFVSIKLFADNDYT